VVKGRGEWGVGVTAAATRFNIAWRQRHLLDLSNAAKLSCTRQQLQRHQQWRRMWRSERIQVVSIIAVELFGIVALQFMQKCQATIKIQSDSNSCQLNAMHNANNDAYTQYAKQSPNCGNNGTLCVDHTRNMTDSCCNL